MEMRSLFGFLCIFGMSGAGCAAKIGGEIHAVLIAGSNGYWNYRHQADVAHAYHVLTDHGVTSENIITLMFDDVATSPSNPFPGMLFNEPNGTDVYEGVRIDYRGEDVNPQNFMAVLKGDEKAVKGGNGRVLKSNKNDKLFVYFADHGDVGVVAVIDELLTSYELHQTLRAMHKKGLYGELVFYLESCESGSMFENKLPNNTNILAITAANASQSSWGVFCDDPTFDTCLGDQFSVSWMQDSDAEDLNKETLEAQYEIVRNMTDLSHVMKYGDLSITREFVGMFQGLQPAQPSKTNRQPYSSTSSQATTRWPSREIPLRTLESRLKRTIDPLKRAELQKEIAELKTKRSYHDAHARALIQKLLPQESETVHDLVFSQRPSAVTNDLCHHEALHAYHKNCFNLGRNPYAMKISGPLASICDRGVSMEEMLSVIGSHCQHMNSQMENIH